MLEVPFARIPEEPGAVVPHAGICAGGGPNPLELRAVPTAIPSFLLFPTLPPIHHDRTRTVSSDRLRLR